VHRFGGRTAIMTIVSSRENFSPPGRTIDDMLVKFDTPDYIPDAISQRLYPGKFSRRPFLAILDHFLFPLDMEEEAFSEVSMMRLNRLVEKKEFHQDC